MLMRLLDWFLSVWPVRWWLRARILGLLVFTGGTAFFGLGVAQAVAPAGTAAAVVTYTVHKQRVVTHTKLITIHVRGRVLRRHDHVLVVLIPRVVFRNHTTHKRIVVPAHVVRIQEPSPIQSPVFPVTEAAVIGVAPPAITIYVPTTVTITVPVDVPGPTVTSVSVSTATTTVTLPQDTTTVFTTSDTGPPGSN